jgi:hypothetical protein
MLCDLGVVYLGVLEEFLMSILEETIICYSNKTDAGFVNSQVSREIDSQVQVYHLTTSFTWLHSPSFSFFCVYIKDVMPSLATTLPWVCEGTEAGVDTVTLGLLRYLPGHSRCPHWTSIKCRSQKLDQMTCSNTSSFYSCAFYFMSNFTANGIHFICTSCISVFGHFDTKRENKCS